MNQLIKTISSKPFFRNYDIRKDSVNQESRTVELSFSSADPVERFFGFEILDHDKKSIRLDRLANGGPLLMDHDTTDQIGVIDDVAIKQDKGRAIVRFSKSARGEEIFQDVLDGIRKSVSVGYRVHSMVLEESNDNVDTYRVTDWEPLEISLVSVPADASVGVGRMAENQETEIKIYQRSDEEMTATATTNQTTAAPIVSSAPVAIGITPAEREAEMVKTRDRELMRIRNITALGDQFDQKEMARKFIDENKSIDEMREAVLAALGDRAPLRPAESAEIGLSEREKRGYSFVRVMHALANPNDRRARENAAFEFECSAAAADKRNKPPQGILIPVDILAMKRDLTVGTATAGGHTVATDLLTGSFIELLRNRLALSEAGATILTDLVGDIAIPRQTSGATGYWLAESGAPTESAQAFDQVTMAPKTVGAFTDYSRKLLLQSSIDVESFVRMDLSRVLAINIDLAGLEGTGAGNQPTGIINTSGVNTQTVTTPAAPTYAEIVGFESTVAVDNADVAGMAYVMNATMRGTLKTTEKATNTAQFVWEPGNTVNGYRTVISNQVAANGIYFGNYADLLIGMWSGLDVMVDPYTGSTSGTVRIVALQDVDVAVRHPVSFCINA